MRNLPFFIYRHAAISTLWPLDSICHSALRFVSDNSYNTYHSFLYDKVSWCSQRDLIITAIRLSLKSGSEIAIMIVSFLHLVVTPVQFQLCFNN